jgi:hypothetical protein
MYTTVIPNTKTPHSKEYSLERKGRSDAILLYALLDIIANDILFTDITALKPIYTPDEKFLFLVVEYSSY